MGSITCFILALQYAGNTYAWNSSVVIGMLVGSALIAAALVCWEIWLGDYAMMMPRLYRQRSLWTTAPFQFFFMGSYIVLLYYLPIYFQSILGVSPISSGVHNLPLVLAAAVFALAGGAVVMMTGRAQQTMFVGSSLATVAIGLIYTLDIGSSTGKWVGYQFFVGASMAIAIMQGLTMAQAYAEPQDLAPVTANLLCMFSIMRTIGMPVHSLLTHHAVFQTVGGAYSTSAGQAAFVNQLLATLPRTAPTVNPRMLFATGASEIQRAFPPEVLPGVLQAYMTGIKAAFAVAVAFSGMAFLCTLAMPRSKLPGHRAGGSPPVMG